MATRVSNLFESFRDRRRDEPRFINASCILQGLEFRITDSK